MDILTVEYEGKRRRSWTRTHIRGGTVDFRRNQLSLGESAGTSCCRRVGPSSAYCGFAIAHLQTRFLTCEAKIDLKPRILRRMIFNFMVAQVGSVIY